MSDGDAPPPLLRLLLGVAFAAAGVVPILAALDVAPFRASGIEAPTWIGFAIGAIFLAGAAFLSFAGAASRRAWLAAAFGLAITAAFAVLFNWIAFGPGPRACSGSFSFAIFTSARWVPDLECRVAFGLGALMCNGLIAVLAGKGLAEAGVAGKAPAMLEKIGTGLIVAGFVPFLILFVAFKLAELAVRWVRERLGRGTTPP